jgi:hypothetical protein
MELQGYLYCPSSFYEFLSVNQLSSFVGSSCEQNASGHEGNKRRRKCSSGVTSLQRCVNGIVINRLHNDVKVMPVT